MKLVHLCFSVLSITFLLACGSEQRMTNNKTPDQKNTEKGTYIISGSIVEKQRIWKGEISEQTDLYVQRSIDDYFIKFCESKITRKAIEDALKKANSRTLKIEIEYRDGEWDNCQENSEVKVASRTGQYVIIHKLF